MVRLKPNSAFGENAGRSSFNSTMVRLKQSKENRIEIFEDKFQFHNGSIKTL